MQLHFFSSTLFLSCAFKKLLYVWDFLQVFSTHGPNQEWIHVDLARSWKKKAKQKHLSVHACTSRRMSNGGV